jgi:EpsI family protein
MRVYGIILLGYLAGSSRAARVDHVISGFIFFFIVSATLMFAGLPWREVDSRISPRRQYLDGESSSDTAGSPDPVPAGSLLRSGLFAVLAVLLAGLAPLAARFLSYSPQEELSSNGALPVITQPWYLSDQALYGWKPQLLGSVTEYMQAYQAEDAVVKICVKSYGARQKGAKLVGSENRMYESPEWVRTADRTVSVIISAEEIRVHETSVHSAKASLLIWNWYSVDGRFTSNPVMVKLLLARAWLTGSRRSSAAIVVATEQRPTGPPGASTLMNFLGHLSLDGSPPTHTCRACGRIPWKGTIAHRQRSVRAASIDRGVRCRPRCPACKLFS